MTNSTQTRRKFSQLVAGNPPLVSLRPEKSSKKRGGKHCKGRTKAGGACHAPVVEAGLCFFHANPEKLAELGRQGGQKNRRWPLDVGSLPHRSLKSINKSPGCWKKRSIEFDKAHLIFVPRMLSGFWPAFS